MIPIRTTLLNQRKALSALQQTQWSDAIAAHVLSTEVFQQAQHIACYLPFGGEVQTEKIIAAIWDLQKHCYLPVLKPSHLQFAAYTPKTDLIKSSAGFLQPTETKKIIAPENLDLVILPLVGFDQHCHRIGRGVGYYDRTFKFLNTTPRPAQPFLLGLAYAMQQIKECPKKSWDVGLNMVITEKSTWMADNENS